MIALKVALLVIAALFGAAGWVSAGVGGMALEGNGATAGRRVLGWSALAALVSFVVCIGAVFA